MTQLDSTFDSMDATAMAEAVRQKKVSATELLEESIRRTEQVNPKLNIVVIKMYEQGRRDAAAIDAGTADVAHDAAFRGVPFLLKELGAAYKGVPFRGASRLFYDYVPDFDAEIVTRWKKSGLVMFGKTNTPEFGVLPITEPELYGAAHNPWRLGHTPGGSSGGAAASVAARIVPVAHAGDGGGSIRIPSSACGVFGFKPSRARTPTGPDSQEDLHGCAIQHAITRSVRDSAALLDAVTGEEITQAYSCPPNPRSFLDETKLPPGKLRVAFWTDPLVPADPTDGEVVQSIEETARLLESLGHHVERARPKYDGKLFAGSFFRLFCSAAAGELVRTSRDRGSPVHREEVELTTWLIALFGSAMSAGEFSAGVRDMQDVSMSWARFLTDYDVLLTPALARVPIRHGSIAPNAIERVFHEFIGRAELSQIVKLPGVMDRLVASAYQFAPFTMFANTGGLPSMSVPLGFAKNGLPIGSMFTARFAQDAKLFRLAAQLEQTKPWFAHVPRHAASPYNAEHHSVPTVM